ncbi:MAG: cysteine desulfurase NifS [Oscillospiraceae bacterium]|nr:cysteine desulfurase NifS [Oscillospiraceae bacterium]
MKRIVYADNAATTAVSAHVFEAMEPYLRQNYGNPNSIYSIARTARNDIENARINIAKAFGADSKEIFFTSCGTESNNWAIFGAARVMAKKGKKHIITTNFEHHSVSHCVDYLSKNGFEVTYLPVDGDGLISPGQVEEAIRPDTALVTVMYANNEIGTILPISEIGEICRVKGVLLHTDAVQAAGSLRIDLSRQDIDLMSVSGHKIHAPKGIGLLYIRKGVQIENLMYGGNQERMKRPGTENTPSIIGLAAAVEKAVSDMEHKTSYVTSLRDRLIDGLVSRIPKVRINGSLEHRLCGNVNVSFEGIEGESILLGLDMAGICASSGSACTSGTLDPSHVLLAIGLSHEIAHGSLRLTLGQDNTEEDVEHILVTLPPIVERLRKLSPLWHE